MCRKRILFSTYFILFMFAVSSRLMAEAPDVTYFAVATDIKNLTPEGVSEDRGFPSSVGKVYAFTHVEGAIEPTEIKHIWYWEGNRVAEVPLKVESANYRTYSSKQIVPRWEGEWKVEALDEKGRILDSYRFAISDAYVRVRINIKSNPGFAMVCRNIDNGIIDLGNTGEIGLSLTRHWKKGKYKIEVTKAGYEMWTKEIFVEENPTDINEDITLVKKSK